MHGAVLLDRADKPIRPAILHNDGRAFLEADELARDYPDLAQVVGVKPMPGFTGPKLKWIARNEPEPAVSSTRSCRRRIICASSSAANGRPT